MNEKMTAIIVDDERHARQGLCHLLEQHPYIEVIAECENGLVAVKFVHEKQPDILFLDIQMPKLDGFDVLELLGDDAPLIVFVTAHDDYAVQAFESNAVDYLLKPVNNERMAATIKRLQDRLSRPTPDDNNLPQPVSTQSQLSQNQLPLNQLLQNHLQQQAPLNRILVREQGDVHVIACADVVAMEAADDYVVIQTLQRSYIKQERLSHFEKHLDSRQFCRIHRSTLINLDYLLSIETEGKDTRFANLKNQKQYPISRSGYTRLISIL